MRLPGSAVLRHTVPAERGPRPAPGKRHRSAAGRQWMRPVCIVKDAGGASGHTHLRRLTDAAGSAAQPKRAQHRISTSLGRRKWANAKTHASTLYMGQIGDLFSVPGAELPLPEEGQQPWTKCPKRKVARFDLLVMLDRPAELDIEPTQGSSRRVIATSEGYLFWSMNRAEVEWQCP